MYLACCLSDVRALIAESGFMIDIHCHILPGLDDGPDSMEETLEMCRLSVERGMTGIIATPHMFNGMFPTDRKSILESYALVRDVLASEGVPLKLYAGADLHLVPGLGEKIQNNSALTLNDGRYFLLEFPSRLLPPNLNQVVEELIFLGYIPIITHPERNEAILKREEILFDLIHLGALCQITAMSLTGEFGKRCERFARTIIEAGAVHFIASDAHSTGWRSPGLDSAVRVAEQLIGRESARRLVRDHPEAVLSNSPIETIPVKRPVRRKRFWLF